ncbi:MAG: S8 family peptidase [Bacillota bacterium]|nr:S8 family peptidase [Bacillota bacterium]
MPNTINPINTPTLPGILAGLSQGATEWELIVQYYGDILRVGKELNVEVEILNESYAIITIKQEQILQLLSSPEVIYIEFPKKLVLLINETDVSTCITSVHSPTGYNLSGKGTIVAFIDSGIDYHHPDFINDDGTSRILYIWDQTATGGKPPSDFNSGVEYDNAQINKAIKEGRNSTTVPQTDDLGHGTAVAAVAAGNGRALNGKEKGIAPEANIIMVKIGVKGNESFANTTELMRGVKYVIDKAEELNMPLSLNMSFGTNNGSHDGNSLFESYINDMARKWKTVIVVASGNEGDAAHHYFGKINENQTLEVPFVMAPGLDFAFMTFWKNFTDDFTIELIAPSGDSTGIIDSSRQINTLSTGGSIITILYGEPTNYSVQQEIYFEFNKKQKPIPSGLWRLKVAAQNVVDGNFDIWLPTVELVTTKTAFSLPTAYTTLTLPSTVQNVISVGGYDANISAIASFSGRGFTSFYVFVKPDLVAPAVNVLSANTGGGYSTFSGTSIAAPFVTGAAAIMMEWGIVKNNDVFLYGQKVKAFLQKGANQSPNIDYPNQQWGYGSLCLKKTLDLLNSSRKGG